MPKSYGGLFERFVSWDNLIRAYAAARIHKKTAPGAMRVHERYDGSLVEIRSALINGSWRPEPYKCFRVFTETKIRDIQAPAFKDRIVHHAIVQILEPLYEKKFIFDSYSCRKGKGSHATADRAQSFLREAAAKWGNCYVLKCDISKYFPSIRHQSLFGILGETVREGRFRAIIERAAVAPGNDSGYGLPIGALTSQLFSNVYLDKLDHFVKECCGVKYYVRYADDFVVIGDSSRGLLALLDDIRWYLDTQLWLRLNPKTGISRVSQGVDLCGYRIWPTHRLPRKRVVRAAKSRLRALARMRAQGRAGLYEIQQSAASFIGYMRHCSGGLTTSSVLRTLESGGMKVLRLKRAPGAAGLEVVRVYGNEYCISRSDWVANGIPGRASPGERFRVVDDEDDIKPGDIVDARGRKKRTGNKRRSRP